METLLFLLLVTTSNRTLFVGLISGFPLTPGASCGQEAHLACSPLVPSPWRPAWHKQWLDRGRKEEGKKGRLAYSGHLIDAYGMK